MKILEREIVSWDGWTSDPEVIVVWNNQKRHLCAVNPPGKKIVKTAKQLLQKKYPDYDPGNGHAIPKDAQTSTDAWVSHAQAVLGYHDLGYVGKDHDWALVTPKKLNASKVLKVMVSAYADYFGITHPGNCGDSEPDLDVIPNEFISFIPYHTDSNGKPAPLGRYSEFDMAGVKEAQNPEDGTHFPVVPVEVPWEWQPLVSLRRDVDEIQLWNLSDINAICE